MKNGLIATLLIAGFLTGSVNANDLQTQGHLQTLLGELLHLEQRLDTLPPTGSEVQPNIGTGMETRLKTHAGGRVKSEVKSEVKSGVKNWIHSGAISIIKPGSNYRVKDGDTLGKIAHRAYGDTNIKLDLVMELIIKHNPNAFFRNNANYIYADKVITIPSVDDFRSMLFRGNTRSVLTSTRSTNEANGFSEANDTYDKGHWIRFP